MTITVPSFLMFLAIVQLALAALNVPGFVRWSWFPGGALFAALSLFVSISMR